MMRFYCTLGTMPMRADFEYTPAESERPLPYRSRRGVVGWLGFPDR
jgi:hypothetical protein